MYSSCGALVCLTWLSFSLRRIFKRRKISCNFSLGPLIWSFWEYYWFFPSFFCIPSLQARVFSIRCSYLLCRGSVFVWGAFWEEGRIPSIFLRAPWFVSVIGVLSIILGSSLLSAGWAISSFWVSSFSLETQWVPFSFFAGRREKYYSIVGGLVRLWVFFLHFCVFFSVDQVTLKFWAPGLTLFVADVFNNFLLLQRLNLHLLLHSLFGSSILSPIGWCIGSCEKFNTKCLRTHSFRNGYSQQ